MLKETIQRMKALISAMGRDIEKSERGNKAAAQRVRTATIQFGKLTKIYRQQSIALEKNENSSKKARSKA